MRIIMKATGMVRRIDDLGRVVIPKEIRTMLGIGESDPLEILVDSDNQEIILKKYDTLNYRYMWDVLKKDVSIADKLSEMEENYRRDYM